MSGVTVTEIIKAAGGPAAIGRVIKRHHATIIGWNRVPAEHARAVAQLAGVSPHAVRPDLYDPPAPNDSERAA